MSTRSTRSRRTRGGRRADGRRSAAQAPALPTTEERKASAQSVAARPAEVALSDVEPGGRRDRLWLTAGLVVLALAAVVRLWDLSLAPFHNDEGVNGWFTTRLLRQGSWSYDPANYHGPTLFFSALVSALVFGLNDFALRVVPALYGLATIGLVLAMRRWLGRTGSLGAAALLAVSPGAVYFSRYFIHESLLVLFTVALVFSGLRYWETRRTTFLMAAAASAAAMFATKETALVQLGVLAVAIVCFLLYQRWEPRLRPLVLRRLPVMRRAARAVGGDVSEASSTMTAVESRAARAVGRRGRRTDSDGVAPLDAALAAATVFAIVWLLLFSSFGTNFPQGLVASLEGLAIWTQTGTAAHIQPFLAYLEGMIGSELPILAFSIVGLLVLLLRGGSGPVLFIALWAFGTALAYSIIPYKTPWLALNFVVPMAMIAGYGLTALLNAHRSLRAIGAVALAAGLVLSTSQALTLAFAEYDHDEQFYVYSQTTRDVHDLVDDIDRAADALGSGRQTGVVISAPSYWPLPWYLRDYPRAGFFGRIVERDEPLLIVNTELEDELPDASRERYRRGDVYRLRPGVELVLYYRDDVPAR